MATSGSYDYSLTAADIIKSAYEDLGAISPGGTVNSVDSVIALTRLNMLAKQYQGKADGAPGMKIHTRQRVTLFLAKGQISYLVGAGSNDAIATTLYGRTTVATAYVSGTSLSVAAVSDTTTTPGTTVSMTTGDFIGVQLNDGTISWTTLNGTPGSSPATLTGALAGAAASGNYVWWFTSRAQRFPVLESAVLRSATNNDTPLAVYTEVAQYASGVPSKYADGTPSTILVEPLRTQTRIILNSKPTVVTDTIVMTVLYPAEDYDATTDDIAFPQEAYRFLSWELAFALSPSVGRWTAEMEKNRGEARSVYLNLNPENSALYFQCN